MQILDTIRLIPGKRKAGRVCGIFAILGAFIGGSGLILLSVLDTAQYPTLHRVFLLVFMVGVVMSAIFTVVEVSTIPYLKFRNRHRFFGHSIDGYARISRIYVRFELHI